MATSLGGGYNRASGSVVTGCGLPHDPTASITLGGAKLPELWRGASDPRLVHARNASPRGPGMCKVQRGFLRRFANRPWTHLSDAAGAEYRPCDRPKQCSLVRRAAAEKLPAT